jgi:DNA polymerase V
MNYDNSQVTQMEHFIVEGGIMAQVAKILNFPEPPSVVEIHKVVPGTNKNKYPVYSIRIPAGFPSPSDDYMEKKLSMDEHLILHPDSTFIVTVSGDSMWPLICNGDELIADKSMVYGNLNGKIVIAIQDGDYNVKRLKIQNDRLFLVPENPDYQAKELIISESSFIWAVVTTVIKRVL